MESNSTAFLIKIKLRHSLGRPSRSDFVQWYYVKIYMICTLNSVNLLYNYNEYIVIIKST